MFCPICNYKGEFKKWREKDKWHVKNSWECPQCLSKNSHRLIFLIYKEIKKQFLGGKLLHCSPMKCLKKQFIKDFDYLSIDFPPRESKSGVTMADLKVDLKNTSFDDNFFDIIICSHVLDQIKETDLAIKEIYRIIKMKGIAFLIVPIYPNEKTKLLEVPVINHWWRCGYNFFEKYNEAKFFIKVIKYNDIKNWEEMGLDGEILVLCQK